MNYSVIIPHHNVPKMLERALTSVPRRDDVEIIVVDDASDEKYQSEIEAVCQKKGSQVTLIQLKENGGGGKARNAGLQVAKGKFVTFLDADDYFNYCIAQAMDDYVDDTADIIFFRAMSLYADTYLPAKRDGRINNCVNDFLNGKESGDYELRYVQGCPVSKFIRKSMLDEHDIWFEETRKHNDVRFSYTSGYHAGQIKADPRAVYCIIDRNDSVSADVSAQARLLRVNVVCNFIEFMREHNLAIKNEMTLLTDTMAEIYSKDKMVYADGLKKMEECGITGKAVESALNKAIMKQRIRTAVPSSLRMGIRKFIHI